MLLLHFPGLFLADFSRQKCVWGRSQYVWNGQLGAISLTTRRLGPPQNSGILSWTLFLSQLELHLLQKWDFPTLDTLRVLNYFESFKVIWDQSGMNWCGATISHHMSTKSPPQVIKDSSDSVKQLFWLEISGVNIWTAKFALWLKKKLDSKTCLWFKNNFFPFIKFNSFQYQLQMIFCKMLLKCWWFFLRIYSRKSETFNFSRFFGLQYLNLATRGHRCSSVGLMGFPIFQEVQHFRVLSSLK